MSQRKSPFDFHKKEDVSLMLEALVETINTNKRFKKIDPHFHDAGNLYALDKNGTLLSKKDTTWVSRIPYFSISHNVASVDKALGSGGCKDCHSKTSHLFNGRVVTNFFGENGDPVTVSMAQFLNLKKGVQKWHVRLGNYMDAAPIIWIFLGGILVLIVVCQCLVASSPSIMSAMPVFWGLSLFGMIVLILAHFLLIKEMGVMITLLETFLEVSPVIAAVLLLTSGSLYAYLVNKKIKSKWGISIFVLLAFLTAGTGLILWIKPVFAIGLLLPVSIFHGIFAIGIVAGLIFLLLKKCPPKERKNSMTKKRV